MRRYSRLVTVLHMCSFLVFLYSWSMLVPMFVALWFHEQEFDTFLLTFVLTCGVGLVGWLPGREHYPGA